jgi:hypothetical protein
MSLFSLFYFWGGIAIAAATTFGLFRSGHSIKDLAEAHDFSEPVMFALIIGMILLWPITAFAIAVELYRK